MVALVVAALVTLMALLLVAVVALAAKWSWRQVARSWHERNHPSREIGKEVNGTVPVTRDQLLAGEVREGVAPLEARVSVRHVVELKAAEEGNDHVICRHVRRRLARQLLS